MHFKCLPGAIIHFQIKVSGQLYSFNSIYEVFGRKDRRTRYYKVTRMKPSQTLLKMH